ncbi:MAG: TonB family protein [Pseudobdellovibrionaceae bacterium]
MIFAVRSFLKKKFFFLVSFGIHFLLFVFFLNLKSFEKTDDSALAIEFRNDSFTVADQRDKKRKSPSANISQSTFLQKEITNISRENVTQKLAKNADGQQPQSGQNEMSEGVSDLSSVGRSEEGYAMSYLDKVRSKIEFHKIYPKASKLFKEQGSVKVKLQILKSGHVRKIEIVESSQFKRLDEAAIKAVAEAAPFDQFPSDVKFASWSILIPMRFELN